ncbi:MAG: hypothetical protein ACK5PQ_04520 [Alphaproteobacteria bacterium]
MSIFRKTSFVLLFMGAAFVTFVGRSALNRETSSHRQDEPAEADARLKRWASLEKALNSAKENTDPLKKSGQPPSFIATFPDIEGRWCVKQSGEQTEWGSAKKIPSLSSSEGVVFFLNPVHVKY